MLDGLDEFGISLIPFCLNRKDIQNKVAVKYGASLNRRGYMYIRDLYLLLLNLFSQQKNETEILKFLRSSDDFSFLELTNESGNTYEAGQDFASETKSATFLREALKKPIRCQICQGLLHYNSITMDHIIRKQDGGLGVLNNAQLAHPYCNTTFKN